MVGRKLRKLVDIIHVSFALQFATFPSLKVGSMGLLFEKVKQYPVLYDKQMKEYREKDVVSNAWNTLAKDLKLIDFTFHVVPPVADNSGVGKNR